MSNDKDKQLDDFFKTELEDPVHYTAYNEKDWSALEKTLDSRSKRRILVYWLPVIGSAAALLLLFLGWWMFRDNQVYTPSKLRASNFHHQVNTGTSGGTIRQPIGHGSATRATANFAESGNHKAGSASKTFFTLSAAGTRRSFTGSRKNDGVNTLKKTPEVLYQVGEEILAVRPAPVFEFGQTGFHGDITFLKNTPAADEVKRSQSEHQKDKADKKQQPAFRPQFALSVLAAPDLNGVGSFQQSKVGTNMGFLFSAGVSKKFTISTGVLYSVKPYLTNFTDYHTSYNFRISPVNVTADCRMLDVPLNLGYQVYNKGQNKLSIGTGLSSYIMLHEKYTFNYNAAYSYGPVSYTVPKSSSYWGGVLNLNASYERRLNSKVSITAEPYMKLPLTNIGYGQVKLQTTGVAVGLKWNINSLTKE